MYIQPIPGGITPPSDDDRMPIWRAVNSDDLMLTTTLSVPGHPGIPATPLNSRVNFVLSQDRFSHCPLWRSSWNSGVTPVDGRPGLVRIKIDSSVSRTLRRGSYAFSMDITDVYGKNRSTVLAGSLLVEYEPSSDNHDIPYRVYNPNGDKD